MWLLKEKDNLRFDFLWVEHLKFDYGKNENIHDL